MLKCNECEFYQPTAEGRKNFLCDPFSTVKEPECLQKWQILRLEMLLAGYGQMLAAQQSMEPMHRKMMQYVEREIDGINEADQWKLNGLDEEDEEDLV